ncbi:MAG: class I SAM-dependent methyltransferase [Actinobacteria bacterium]|nr:class I SAM-dependent methyltransferase [Actinomycetota bacterium]
MVTMAGSLIDLRAWLLHEHVGTVCADRLDAITEQLRLVVDDQIDGAVVELGCYRGAMALWTRSVLDALGDAGRAIHVYDSFQGLPEPGPADSDHLRQGELVATPADVVATHAEWGRPSPTIHAGWFSDTLPNQLPEAIAFGYLDGDFHDSTLIGLVHCVPRLSPGGLLVVDDYADTTVNPKAWDGLPGVKLACDEYFGHPSPMEVLVGDEDLAFGRYRRPT